MTATVLRAEGLRLRLGRREILDGVDLHVDGGEVVGLIGPNGAGKSTLLRVLAGVRRCDAGNAWVTGLDVATAKPRELALRLAFVEQHPRFDFSFRAIDHVLLGRHPHLRRFQIERRVDVDIAEDALHRVGMHHLADRDVTTLSGGERQLVSIARGLAQRPCVLLLDEPTAALDLRHQLRVLDLVRSVAAEGASAVVAVHDLDLAARMCDRVVLLAGGRPLATGRPAEVLTTELLLDAYRTHTAVAISPDTGAPTVTPLRPDDQTKTSHDLRTQLETR